MLLLAVCEAACHPFAFETDRIVKVPTGAELLISGLLTDAFANGAWLGLKIAGMILATLLCKSFRPNFFTHSTEGPGLQRFEIEADDKRQLSQSCELAMESFPSGTLTL